MLTKIKLIIIGVLFLAQGAFAGLLTPFTECRLDSVKPGEEYMLTGRNEAPLMIKNTSDTEVRVRIRAVKPPVGELKKNYEQIPDINWISIKDEYLTVGPGQWGRTEAVLRVPGGRTHSGKRYQAYIHTVTTKGRIRAGLESRVLFSVEERKGFFRRIFRFLR